MQYEEHIAGLTLPTVWQLMGGSCLKIPKHQIQPKQKGRENSRKKGKKFQQLAHEQSMLSICSWVTAMTFVAKLPDLNGDEVIIVQEFFYSE